MTLVWSALGTGAVYALIALGYHLTLVAANVVNFAFANVLIFCAFVSLWVMNEHGWPFALALVLCAAVGIALSVIEERVAIRPLAGASTHSELVTTVGAATVITGLAVVLFGSDAKRVPILQGNTFEILGGRMQLVDLVLVVVAVLLAVLVWLGFTRTRLGLASMARSENREAAILRGIDVRGLSLGMFIVAGAIAGLLGPLIGAKTLASGAVPLVLAIKGFIALTLGGVGSHWGAIAGGLLIALGEVGTEYVLGVNFGNFAVFAIFVVVLLVRPNGLFGVSQGRTV